MSAPTKYISRTPPAGYQRSFHSDVEMRIQLTTDSIIALLGALNVAVEIGPVDSGGAGFRVLRIPN